MAAIFGWFLFMELFGADEQSANRTSTAALYSGTFVWEKADGTSEEIKVPGRYRVPAGETMVLTTTLPDNYDETAFAIRSSLQDVKFYIGGELRAEYSTKETRLVGKNSSSRFVFCPTSYKDAGKELRLELTTYTSNYSGVFHLLWRSVSHLADYLPSICAYHFYRFLCSFFRNNNYFIQYDPWFSLSY